MGDDKPHITHFFCCDKVQDEYYRMEKEIKELKQAIVGLIRMCDAATVIKIHSKYAKIKRVMDERDSDGKPHTTQ